ncbi:hypothetical protein ACFV1W_21410 [Kitasatospora sp. NPDC059648]|uniref:hypothetical protein n=1 Tax=Kitasatospora sp. NPDC059648 TaxID=3346894 RepID=UPI0036965B53
MTAPVEASGPSRVDRRKTGSKHHVISDGGGIPFHLITTDADVEDEQSIGEPADGGASTVAAG